MKRTTGLESFAIRVGDALRRHGVEAVMTGGACASIHSGGLHHSVDVDFVLAGDISQDQLDRAMHSVGFTRRRDRYVHAEHEIEEFLAALKSKR